MKYTLSTFTNFFERAAKDKSKIGTFDDFLTLCLNSLTRMPDGNTPYYEKECSDILKRHSEAGTYDKLTNLVLIFFNATLSKTAEPDMLGDLCKDLTSEEQIKSPQPSFKLCLEIAIQCDLEISAPCCVFDTMLGTGRMLLAFAKNSAFRHTYFGVDTNPISTKLAALNMLLHGLEGEVICAYGYDPENFFSGYRISRSPVGIFRIDNKEKSLVWKMNRDSFASMRKEHPERKLLFL